jgi:demethylmenaquinone methyltransferase/2-methoxy-6-polyprenyl-1,4-benzoquinol methylase
MALDKKSIALLYRRRAKLYDISANAYYLLGFREFAYRKIGVKALNLKKGDTVVEIGCGTGLNFSLLRKQVGPKGNIIGVDLTLEILEEADKRIRRNGWQNVTLVQSDAAEYKFPGQIDGIISTFAITLVPEYDRIIQNGAAALSPNARFVVVDFKKPDKWPMWIIKAFVILTRPFGISLDIADRHPWESVARYMTVVEFRELYFGGLYLCVGKAPTGENG